MGSAGLAGWEIDLSRHEHNVRISLGSDDEADASVPSGGRARGDDDDSDAGAGRAPVLPVGGSAISNDEINFHHSATYRINPIVHEKRGVVGFSKTRRASSDMAAESGLSSWVRQAARMPPPRDLTVVHVERPSPAAKVPPRPRLRKAASSSSLVGPAGAAAAEPRRATPTRPAPRYLSPPKRAKAQPQAQTR